MKKLLLIASLLVIAGGLFIFRPWSEYKPLNMNRLFHPEDRVENFRHMDRVFPVREISASNTPFIFKRDEKPLEVSYQFKGKDRSLAEFLDEVEATGLLVIQNDTIIHERYFQGGNNESTFTSWSMAKSFVGTLIGMALGDGKIASLDDPITQYLPELSTSGYADVPIRHILQMSSGVDFNEAYDDKLSDINLFFWKVFILGMDADDVVASYGKAEESGQLLHYISIDTHVLGMLLRRLYQKPLTTLLEERIWQPLGMEGDAFWNIDADSEDATEIAFCCLNARLRDFAKLGRLYLNNGVWQGQRLLPEGWVVEATTPAADHLQPGGNTYGGRGYQYQWWIPPNYDREYFASGVWGQYVYVSEKDNLIIARTSVDPNFRKNMPETMAVFRAIRDHLRERQTPSAIDTTP